MFRDLWGSNSASITLDLKDPLEQLFNRRACKEDMIAFVRVHPEQFEDVIQKATENEPEAWRAAWLLGHCMRTNDERVRPYLSKLISLIAQVNDGHQRELIKVLQKMVLDEIEEGRLFNICMSIWEDVKKTPSVRITAFRMLRSIASKFPELTNELEHLAEEQYTRNLSHGIKNSFKKLMVDRISK